MMTDYDPKAAARALASAQPETGGRKLTFYNQCSAFYALYSHIAPRVVAEAFGVTMATVSNLAGCLKHDPRPTEIIINGDRITRRSLTQGRNPNRIQRYARVADEFERLGEDAFAAKYFPHDVAARVGAVKHKLPDAGAPPRAYNPKANKDVGDWIIPAGPTVPESVLNVRLIDGEGFAYGEGGAMTSERFYDATKALRAGYRWAWGNDDCPQVRVSEKP
jgi:hypothetical protein